MLFDFLSLFLLDQIRRSDDVKVPVIVEGGGVGDNYFTALALGMKIASKPSIGINLSGAGDMVFVDNKEKPFMIYDGEASSSSKYYGNRLDRQGRPIFVEGAVNTRYIYHNAFTQHVLDVLEPVGIGLVFQQAKSLDHFHKRRKSMIVRGTAAAVGLSDAYGRREHK